MKNWRKYIYEFLSIFIGVTMAFAVTNWNENRRDARAATKILTEIRNGLTQDQRDFAGNVAGHKKGIKACTYFRGLVVDSICIESDSFRHNYYHLLRDYISIQNKSGYESLKVKGLELVSDDSLRLNIISLYDFDYEVIEKLEEEYSEMQFSATYFSCINNLLVPYIKFAKDGRPNYIEIPVPLSEIDKNKLLTYLWRIEYNRKFILSYYTKVQKHIEQLIEKIDDINAS